MSSVSGVTRMNIAAMDDEILADLRAFFAEHASPNTAPYLAAVDEEIDLRTREPV